MTNVRKKQIKTIGILLVAVIGLAVGFSAFSSSLNIKTKLSVNPNNGTFLVKFSKNASTLDESSVVPTKSSDIFSAYNGVIDNTGIPTISNLGGEFTQPGETITYDFYALNTGSYNAYLTDVIFNNVDGEVTNKVCTSTNGTNQSAVDEACKNITIKVIVGTNEITQTRSLSGHELSPNQSEPVKVVISYLEGGILPEVEFDVEFGNISMIYNSLEEGDIQVPQQQNPWLTRGLTSSNVAFDKVYLNTSSGEIIMGAYSNGGFYGGESGTSSSDVDFYISQHYMEVGEDYVLMNLGDGYMALVFDSSTTVSMYVDENSTSFTKQGIINNSEEPMIFTLTNNQLPAESNTSGSGSGSGSDSSESLGFSTCYISTDNGTSGLSEGDYIKCGSEGFYAISDPSNDEIAMIAETNLNTSSGYQGSGTLLEFQSSNNSYGYWMNGSNTLDNSFTPCTGESYCYTNNGVSYPIDVYGITNSQTANTSSLAQYVNSYVGLLNSALSTKTTGRLITFDELINLGCTYSNSIIDCTGTSSWVTSTNYWIGSAGSYDGVFGSSPGNSFSIWGYNTNNGLGIRPVIEISTSLINVS